MRKIVERLPWPLRWLLGWRRFETAQEANDYLRRYLNRKSHWPRGRIEYERDAWEGGQERTGAQDAG